ncbi:MAG TPA: hypothetical protein VGN82_08440 [Bosea sp. (in: a-proteobacteria)]|jgi:hypothetical protein|uniref:hypothetical protein n=1 Tax=Bosea sp. (in: a-proteobacteria) TaxID=1871050 RepID=UPI002E0F4B9E|nr:hypothetical protein [Bosea sp. (in: a-proteobacteria)]
MRALASIALALVLTAEATETCPHEAPSGWDYPFECCSGADCAQLDPKAVKANASGFIVTVVPGQHPIWSRDRRHPLVLEIAYRKARLSPDGKWHLCINDAGDLLCFFAPAGGS